MKKFLALTVCLAILLTFGSCAAFRGTRKAIASENFTVNVAMLSYYFHNEYRYFLKENSSNLSYFSLDIDEPLAEQPFGGPAEGGEVFYYDELFLEEHEGTWFDYFMDRTVESVSAILLLCEEAMDRNLLLSDEEMAKIDEEIERQKGSFKELYGNGAREKDVRQAMEYELLAEKCLTEVYGISHDTAASEPLDEILQEQLSQTQEYIAMEGLEEGSVQVSFVAPKSKNQVHVSAVQGFAVVEESSKSRLVDRMSQNGIFEELSEKYEITVHEKNLALMKEQKIDF